MKNSKSYQMKVTMIQEPGHLLFIEGVSKPVVSVRLPAGMQFKFRWSMGRQE